MRATPIALFIDPRYGALRYRCAIALYLLILILGSVPGARDDIGYVAPGLVLHSLAYAGLTYLLFSGTQGTPTRRALQSVATIALMGALDEVVQSFVPYRNGAVSDWLVDCSASAVVALLLWTFWPRIERAWQRRPA